MTGGRDKPCVPGDPGIFVKAIKQGSLVEKIIRPGDKVLKVIITCRSRYIIKLPKLLRVLDSFSGRLYCGRENTRRVSEYPKQLQEFYDSSSDLKGEAIQIKGCVPFVLSIKRVHFLVNEAQV